VPALITWWTLDVFAVAPHAHNDAVAGVGANLLSRWDEPARHYHTTRHLVEMFGALEELEEADEIDDRQGSLARLAAWFHDAVYVPTAPAGSNEADSATFARKTLQQLGFADHDIEDVDRLIRLTASHHAAQDDPLGSAFHDADLWILAAPEERFDSYCDQVRAEYASVPEAAYSRSRAAVLGPLMHRDSVYRTSRAIDLWERPARINLGRELTRLRD
jgi:predicted metal-dependent HD superfamily phosphohydrolase